MTAFRACFIVLVLSFAALALSACASSKEEIHGSISDAIDCLRRKAPILDDHISSADSVAYGLTAACGSESLFDSAKRGNFEEKV